jgi:hypothetical protein
MRIIFTFALAAIAGLSLSKDCKPTETKCVGAVGVICCPVPNAHCCSDGFHCCAEGQECDLGETICKQSNGPNAFFRFPLIKPASSHLEELDD